MISKSNANQTTLSRTALYIGHYNYVYMEGYLKSDEKLVTFIFLIFSSLWSLSNYLCKGERKEKKGKEMQSKEGK